MHLYEGEKAEPAGGADRSPRVAAAVRDCLAPLRMSDVFEPAVQHVLGGARPEVLAALREQPSGAEAVAEPDGYWASRLTPAVAELHPGWTRQAAAAARLAVYQAAPADVLARFGQVLHAAAGRDAGHGEPSWLLVLAHDVGRASEARGAVDVGGSKTGTETESVRRRWIPDLVAEVARAGDAPGRSPVHATLSALLHADQRYRTDHRHRLLESDAGAAFLARYSGELAEVVTGLEFYVRRHVALVCGRRPEAHAALVAELAVDADGGVRAAALVTLSRLAASQQVDALRQHLRTVSPDRLPDALARLADLDGGVAAIEEVLADGDTGPLDPDRERLLRRVIFRVRVLRTAQATIAVPAVAAPHDPDLAQELHALRAVRPGSGPDADRTWSIAEARVARLPDVRALRDARRAAGADAAGNADVAADDADRWTAALLVTSARKHGPAPTPEGAGRWWPLFAERLDLADEYLDGGDGKRHPDQRAVDTRAMILTVLERFPAVPEALVPRLTELALGANRHRLQARRVLGDHPGARTAALDALAGSDDAARSSAAEWLAELGEPGAVGPEPGWEFGEGVLPRSVRTLPASTLWWLDRFREQALDRGVPASDVDRWLGLARPTLRTAPDGGGPVVGRLGSPLMLPPGVPTSATVWEPDGRNEHQLIVTLDLAAVPQGATDLQLPPGGHVLLFANVELEDELLPGGAVYVPAGTQVEERAVSLDYEPYGYESPEELDDELRGAGDLRLVSGVSLPSCPLDHETRARHPWADVLQDVWSEQSDEGGRWQLGGYAYDFDGYGDPARESAVQEPGASFSRPEDWVVLAQWVGVPMGILYWTITRQDLEACRFDRVVVRMYANP